MSLGPLVATHNSWTLTPGNEKILVGRASSLRNLAQGALLLNSGEQMEQIRNLPS